MEHVSVEKERDVFGFSKKWVSGLFFLVAILGVIALGDALAEEHEQMAQKLLKKQ